MTEQVKAESEMRRLRSCGGPATGGMWIEECRSGEAHPWPWRGQTDMGVAYVVLLRCPATELQRLAAAQEWRRRYPSGPGEGKRWAMLAEDQVRAVERQLAATAPAHPCEWCGGLGQVGVCRVCAAPDEAGAEACDCGFCRENDPDATCCDRERQNANEERGAE